MQKEKEDRKRKRPRPKNGKFSVKYLDNLEPDTVKYVIREARGFAIMVRPSGLKQFIYIFELNNDRGHVILGSYPGTTLEQARLLYNEAFNLVKNGRDPRVEKEVQFAAIERAKEETVNEETKAATIAASLVNDTFESLIKNGVPPKFVPITVEQLAAVWVVRYSRKHHKPRWQETALSALKCHVIPAIGQLMIRDVRRVHALALIEKIADTVPGSARNTRKFCSQLFDFAIEREWAELQPFTKMTKSIPSTKQKRRRRYLADNELVHAWKAITSSSFSGSTKRALKLIAVTAQRPGEVASLHRSQIDGRWWTIPDPKNERPHRVYLTDTALKLIGNEKGYIFPSDRGNTPHISENSLSQAINRGYVDSDGAIVRTIGNHHFRARKERYLGMEPWTPHDLRRTARTNLARVGVSNEVGEEVINHMKEGLVDTYNQFEYDEEKQAALIKWEDLLLKILKDTQIL